MDRVKTKFLQDKVAAWALAMGTLGWLICVLLVVAYWAKLPPQIPFLYSLPWGESWLITKTELSWVLVGFGTVLVFNLILARTIVREEKLLQYFLLWGAAAVEFMLLVDLIKIINLIV
jgi:hypothetical protein